MRHGCSPRVLIYHMYILRRPGGCVRSSDHPLKQAHSPGGREPGSILRRSSRPPKGLKCGRNLKEQLQVFYVKLCGENRSDSHSDKVRGADGGHHQCGARWQFAVPAWVRSVALAASAAGISHLDDLSQIASHLSPERTAHLEVCDREIWLGVRHYQQASDDPEAYLRYPRWQAGRRACSGRRCGRQVRG
eukprot:4884986-Pleurochrysis_carterae.AAC.1